MTPSLYTVGIDPGKDNYAAVLLDGQLIATGIPDLDLERNLLVVGDHSVPLLGTNIGLEAPNPQMGMFTAQRSRQAQLIKLTERATELRVKLSGCRAVVYKLYAADVRRAMTRWTTRMTRYDEKKKCTVKYSFDSFLLDKLIGLGVHTGRGTLLNNAHKRDALLYALYVYVYILKRPSQFADRLRLS